MSTPERISQPNVIKSSASRPAEQLAQKGNGISELTGEKLNEKIYFLFQIVLTIGLAVPISGLLIKSIHELTTHR